MCIRDRYDETELKDYIKANEDNKLVVALAYLDNYEEALESVQQDYKGVFT